MKWEYKVFTLAQGEDLEEKLNSLAMEGWRLKFKEGVSFILERETKRWDIPT